MAAPKAKHCPGAMRSLAKPQPPWVDSGVVVEVGVTVSRIELQLSRLWSSYTLVSLLILHAVHSGLVWRGPVPKIQVTPIGQTVGVAGAAAAPGILRLLAFEVPAG